MLSAALSSIKLLSCVWLFVTPWTSNHLILCFPLLLLPSIFPSISVLSNESVFLISWPKYWSFSISPSIEDSGVISFRMHWLDLLAVQGTLKSLVQHHSSKTSIFQGSALFKVHFSHICMTTGKIIALTRQTFVSRVMSQLFNMLSRLVMGFPNNSVSKESAGNAGDPGSIPGLGRSVGEWIGYPLQHSGLENFMDCKVYEVAVSDMTEWLTLSLSG